MKQGGCCVGVWWVVCCLFFFCLLDLHRKNKKNLFSHNNGDRTNYDFNDWDATAVFNGKINDIAITVVGLGCYSQIH